MGERQLVVAAVVVDRLPTPTRVLAARRRDPVGRWEFPGGKVEPGEHPVEAVRRELVEELGLEVLVADEFRCPSGPTWPISARYELRAWFATIEAGTVAAGPDHDQVRWLTRHTLDEVDWLPADRAIVAELRRRL